MAEDLTGKRLRKKVLDRWENEGGRIIADTAATGESGPKSDHEGELNQLSGAHGNPALGAPTSSAKERKPAEE